MCIATPKIGATNVPAPTDASAGSLQLGTSSVRNGGILGRLALTGGVRSARAVSSSDGAPTPTAGSDSSGTPGGTIGLPSNYLGKAIFGGLKPKP